MAKYVKTEDGYKTIDELGIRGGETPDSEQLDMLYEAGIVSPAANENNAIYTDGRKIFVL